MSERQGEQRAAVEIVCEIAAITDPDERRLARIGDRERIADYRLQARRMQGAARLADAFAKFGGGSLLTTTLLLMINGKAPLSVAVTAVIALLIFLGCTILWVLLEFGVAKSEEAVERLEAVLKETER